MRAGEGITGVAAAERAPVMIPAKAHLDPRFKAFPNLREDQYESILAVPILLREKLEGALNVRTRAPRAFTRGGDRPARRDRRRRWPSRSSTRASTRRRSSACASWRRSPGSPRRSPSRSTWRSRSRRSCSTTVDSLDATGAAIVLEDGRIAWPEGRAGQHAVRMPLRWKGRTIGELVVDRDSPFTRGGPPAAGGDRAPGGGGARARTHGAARRARPGDPPPGQEQPADGGLAAAPAGPGRGRRPAEGARRLRQPRSSPSPPSTRS